MEFTWAQFLYIVRSFQIKIEQTGNDRSKGKALTDKTRFLKVVFCARKNNVRCFGANQFYQFKLRGRQTLTSSSCLSSSRIKAIWQSIDSISNSTSDVSSPHISLRWTSFFNHPIGTLMLHTFISQKGSGLECKIDRNSTCFVFGVQNWYFSTDIRILWRQQSLGIFVQSQKFV